MTSNGEAYKHWTNHETWITHHWLTHDAHSHERWCQKANQLAGPNPGPVEVNQTIHVLADELRKTVETDCFIHRRGLERDLLESAMEKVIWREIAKVIVSVKIPAAVWFDWLFPFSRIVETERVAARVSRQERLDAVARHAHGDWGEIDGVFWSENDSALRCGDRLYSEYRSKTGRAFLVTTTGDRGLTRVLLPKEHQPTLEINGC